MHLDWIDRYKGFLIVLVVLGHVVGGAVHLTQGLSQHILNSIYLVVYTFHMPAFFYIAGATWKQRDENLMSFVQRKARRLLVPYMVFGILSSMIYCLTIGNVHSTLHGIQTTSYYSGKFSGGWMTCLLGLLHGGGYPNGEGFRMNSVLWFLPCLFSTEVVYWGVRRMKFREIFVVVTCVVLAFMAPFLMSGLPWGVSKVPYYLLFMMLGSKMSSLSLDLVKERRLRIIILVACVIGYISVVRLLPNPAVALPKSRMWWFVFLAFAVVGCILFAKVAMELSGSLLVTCGKASMGIMLTHKFLVVFLEMKIGVVQRLLSAGVLWSIAGCVAIVFVVMFICCLFSEFLSKKSAWMLGGK